jgi:hypothetical protein
MEFSAAIACKTWFPAIVSWAVGAVQAIRLAVAHRRPHRPLDDAGGEADNSSPHLIAEFAGTPFASSASAKR